MESSRAATDMTGTWTGMYWYPENYPIASARGKGVGFQMTLQADGSGGFHGTVQDDVSHGGHPSQGTILGFTDGDAIQFKKTMPDLMSARRDGSKHIVPGLSYSIEYHGRLVSPGLFQGQWTVLGGCRLSAVGAMLFAGFGRTNSGPWEMRRQEPLAP